MCIECRASRVNPETFLKFPCRRGKPEHGQLISADYMCQRCPLLSNDYRAFQAEECPRTGTWQGKNKLDQPPCKLPKAKGFLEDLHESIPPAKRALSLPIPKRTAAKPSPRNPEPMTRDDKDQLMAQLLEAQEQLEQLVLLQSLQDERKRLEKFQQQQMHKNAEAGRALPSI